MQGFTGGGSVGIPHFYLVDAKGRVVGDSIPSERQIEKLLAAVIPPVKLDRKLHAALAKAAASFRRGSLGAAFKAAAPLLTNKDQTIAADARYLRQQIEKLEAIRQKQAESNLKSLPTAKAYGQLLEWKYEFAGLAMGDWAAQRLAALKKDRAAMQKPDMKEWRSAWRKFEEALKREVKMGASAYEQKRVRELYAGLANKSSRSEPGRRARQRLRRLAAK